MMRIGIGCDHGGYALKKYLKSILTECNYEVVDFGADDAESVDYPDYAHYVCEALKQAKIDMGILLCRSGIGMTIAANKKKGIFAALCWNDTVARLAKAHISPNVLVIPADFVDEVTAKRIVQVFIDTKVDDAQRHRRRREKLKELDEELW